MATVALHSSIFMEVETYSRRESNDNGGEKIGILFIIIRFSLSMSDVHVLYLTDFFSVF